MINKKLLFSVRESIPFIKKNVLYQWIGLVCNVLSTACLCWIITRHRSISLVGILFICLILRYIVNQKAIEMSYESSHIVKLPVIYKQEDREVKKNKDKKKYLVIK